jgi:kynurenine formamidase
MKDGITIDELSLEKTVGKAILIDLRKFSTPRRGFTIDQVRQSVGKKEIKEKIVILHSGWIKEKWGKPELYSENPFLTQEAADWLVSQKIKAIGVDFAIDNPDQSLFPLEEKFPIHRTFLKNGIPHIENLSNLERIDRDEFLLVALPLKLFQCNGAPGRAIAIID